jgi:uncharacterized membrane protein
MVSMIAPMVAFGGPAEWLATVLCAVVAWFTRNLLATMAAGLVAVWLLRQTLGS